MNGFDQYEVEDCDTQNAPGLLSAALAVHPQKKKHEVVNEKEYKKEQEKEEWRENVPPASSPFHSHTPISERPPVVVKNERDPQVSRHLQLPGQSSLPLSMGLGVSLHVL